MKSMEVSSRWAFRELLNLPKLDVTRMQTVEVWYPVVHLGSRIQAAETLGRSILAHRQFAASPYNVESWPTRKVIVWRIAQIMNRCPCGRRVTNANAGPPVTISFGASSRLVGPAHD